MGLALRLSSTAPATACSSSLQIVHENAKLSPFLAMSFSNLPPGTTGCVIRSPHSLSGASTRYVFRPCAFIPAAKLRS